MPARKRSRVDGMAGGCLRGVVKRGYPPFHREFRDVGHVVDVRPDCGFSLGFVDRCPPGWRASSLKSLSCGGTCQPSGCLVRAAEHNICRSSGKLLRGEISAAVGHHLDVSGLRWCGVAPPVTAPERGVSTFEELAADHDELGLDYGRGAVSPHQAPESRPCI